MSSGKRLLFARLAFYWLRYYLTSLLKSLNRILRNLTESKYSTPTTKFVFFGPIGKPWWPPGLWFAKTFSTFPLKLLYEIQRLYWKQDLNVHQQVCVFRADRKTKMATRPLICLEMFSFSSEIAEQNSTKLDRKPYFNAPFQFFWADRKTKMAALRSDNKGDTLYSCARVVAL